MPDNDVSRNPIDTEKSAVHSEDGGLVPQLFCVVCGYNLIGIRLDGKCPECGGDVARSTASAAHARCVRRARAAIEVAALSGTTLLTGLAVAVFSMLVGWWFVPIFAVSAAGLGALGLILVVPFVLVPSFGRRRDWLCVLPAVFVVLVSVGAWSAKDEYLLAALGATAAWGFGFAVQGVAAAAARLITDPVAARHTRGFMLFTRAALFTPVAACWMVYFAFHRPRDQGPWEVLQITQPVHQVCAAIIMLWLLCACIHWFFVLARLKL